MFLPSLDFKISKSSLYVILRFKLEPSITLDSIPKIFDTCWVVSCESIISSPLRRYAFSKISRVNNCIFAKINNPDDDLIYAILIKNFSDKQVRIKKNYIEYIIKNIDRSYEKIYEFINEIDQTSLKKKRPIDLKIIKEVLKK